MQIILFLIFVNSHSTHGMSCVNKPYYIIGVRTQFVSMYRWYKNPNVYRNDSDNYNNMRKKTIDNSKTHKNISLTALKNLSYSFSII